MKPYPAERIRPRAARQRTDPDDSYEGADFEENVGQYEENVGGRRRKPTIAEAPPTAGYDAAPYPDDDDRQNGYADEVDQHHPVEDAAYYEYDGREPQRNDVYQEPGQYEDVYDAQGIDDDYGYDRGPAAPRQTGRRRAGRNPRSDREHRTHHDGGRRRLPILAIALAVIAIILLAVNAFVFIPILMGSEPEQVTTTSATEKVDDRLPSIISSGEANAATIPSSSATAIEVPQRNLNVAESIEIFTGSDPTVFEASSNNPIQFESDSEGGFARISSGASAAGARVVIGPGIADRIAGQTIRVTMLARSSQQNGATNMRFALQSGLAISHWQSADLSSNYGNYGMMWHVPTARTAAGDFLLIEPGIPGDGTSTDIRMIKIDIIES